MPLVVAGGEEEPARGEAHEQARKIHPRFARGELRRVAVGRNLAEAELIKGVLLEQGIPSMLTRTGGFDVPDFLAAGPRDVLVPDSGVDAARELLTEVESPAEHAEGGEPAAPRRLPLELRVAAALLAALLLFSLIAGVVWIYAA
ncbi:MAG TPA: DUF2007 domain-containing protein [Solirubrobacterales bacterium]|nr:DUF2007 domain-containing protein [Solirubrobacterales bacterium]